LEIKDVKGDILVGIVVEKSGRQRWDHKPKSKLVKWRNNWPRFKQIRMITNLTEGASKETDSKG